MCGIAGYIGAGDPLLLRDAVGGMVASMERRGPNGSGIEVWDGAVLGHRRLAIFDLSEAGRQPMVTPDRRLGVVFNGAIYNFRELRAEIEAADHVTFRSSTDTEVLLHGYRRWGIRGLVTRLRGMFAFCLWDDDEKKAYLVRDRLGVKPLVFQATPDGIAFASTTRALHSAGLASSIDDQAIAEFLEFGYVTDERSIYVGVSKVPAASILEWHRGRITSRRYWTSPRPSNLTSRRFADVVDEAESLLLAAVDRRLQADVPVGTLLSGGIDSGLVCWAVSELGGDLTAFTVGTPGDPWDETADAAAAASHIGIRHRVVQLEPETLPDLDDLIAAYAEPFACASALGMLAVSKAVSSSATVLLTGDGGDDVFLGYPQHRYLYHAQRIARLLPEAALPAWKRLRPHMPASGTGKRLANFGDYAVGGLGAYVSAHDGLPGYRGRGWLGGKLEEAEVERRRIPWSLRSARHLLDEYLDHDRRTQFVSEYMTKVDGATMHYALEARSPFLDQDLWELAASLPYSQRLMGGELKAVLRAVARRRLGRRTASGAKRGFRIPVHRWVTSRWRGELEEALREGTLEKRGWIRSAPVLKDLERFAAGGEAPHQMWYLLVLSRWLRHESAHPVRAPALA